mmetsp:Transcript_114945/g.199237  ORF Transcript_114945/g.199237 Transcript_114945/m.199237 type:complete len:107 (+) Transcript_114945:2392-2712(+)
MQISKFEAWIVLARVSEEEANCGNLHMATLARGVLSELATVFMHSMCSSSDLTASRSLFLVATLSMVSCLTFLEWQGVVSALEATSKEALRVAVEECSEVRRDLEE